MAAGWMLCALFLAGCGGGGGGGGGTGGGDTGGGGTTPSAIRFTTPNPAGSLAYDADPAALPLSLAVDYSSVTGAVAGSFLSTFTFRGIAFNLSSLFSVGASFAGASSDASPLYWTVLARYSVGSGAFLGNTPIFGVSSGSSGALNMVDADDRNARLLVSAGSRKRLLLIDIVSGAVSREIALSESPLFVRACPAQSKALAALSNDANLHIFPYSGGETTIALPGVPKAMAVNRAAGIAYIIFENSRTLATYNCADNTLTQITLDYLPQRAAPDGLAANRLFYAGGIGADKGVYRLDPGGAQTRLFTVTELPEDMAYDAVRDQLFLVNYSANSVKAYAATGGQLLRTITVGGRPFAALTADAAGKVFVLNKGDDTLSTIAASGSGGAVSAALAADPVGMAVDASGGVLYVLLNIWEISTATPATLSASVRDGSNVTRSSTLNLSIRPVSAGGPGDPGAPGTP